MTRKIDVISILTSVVLLDIIDKRIYLDKLK